MRMSGAREDHNGELVLFLVFELSSKSWKLGFATDLGQRIRERKSKLSRWLERRYGGGTRRFRRVGIVALARKLLVALWRYLDQEVIAEGAILET